MFDTKGQEIKYDKKMTVLAYLTFNFSTMKIAGLLNATKQSINGYKRSFSKDGLIITTGKTCDQIVIVTELGEKVLDSYDGMIY